MLLGGALKRLVELGPLLGEKSAELARDLGTEAPALLAGLRGAEGIAAALPRCEGICEQLGRLRGKKDDEEGRRSLAEVKADLKEATAELSAVQHTVLAAPLARTFERLLGASWAAYDDAKRRAYGLGAIMAGSWSPGSRRQQLADAR